MLEAVKLALGITIDKFDGELQDLIDAALLDLQASGIRADGSDKLILQAVKTYCRLNFQSPPDYEQLLKSYERQKGLLWGATGYTDWGQGGC